MLDGIQKVKDRLSGRPNEDNEAAAEFKGLRLFAANLLVLTSVDLALDALGRTRTEPGPYPHGSPGPERSPLSLATAWLPAVLAPVAAAAQLTQALRPTSATARTARVLNVASVGAGVFGMVGSFLTSRSQAKRPSLAPLAIASAGVLGLILEREERDVARAQRRLEREASLLDRVKPRRGRGTTRIIVRV